MSETTQKCVTCGKQWRDGYVCGDCIKDARADLTTIRDLLAHVDEKRARWTAIDYQRGPGRTSDTPLPYDPRVTKTASPIIVGLSGLHDLICEGIGWHHALPTGSTTTAVTGFIRNHLDWLAGQPEGEEEFRFLDRAAKQLAKLFDAPPDRLYLGTCRTTYTDDDGEWQCPAYVYVVRDKTLPATAECPRCKATIDVNDRRDEFQEQVKLYQATMRELTRLAPMFLEEGVTRHMLTEWTRHGMLRPVGQRSEVGADGKWRAVPTYRIGDLPEARKVWEERKAERRTRRRRSA